MKYDIRLLFLLIVIFFAYIRNKEGFNPSPIIEGESIEKNMRISDFLTENMYDKDNENNYNTDKIYDMYYEIEDNIEDLNRKFNYHHDKLCSDNKCRVCKTPNPPPNAIIDEEHCGMDGMIPYGGRCKFKCKEGYIEKENKIGYCSVIDESSPDPYTFMSKATFNPLPTITCIARNDENNNPYTPPPQREQKNLCTSSNDCDPGYFCVPSAPPKYPYSRCVKKIKRNPKLQPKIDSKCSMPYEDKNNKLCPALNCGTIDDNGNWYNCYDKNSKVCSINGKEDCKKPNIWCEGSPPELQIDPQNKRVIKFVNNTTDEIVIFCKIGGSEYYNKSYSFPDLDFLTMEDKEIVGNFSGVDNNPGWTPFVITTLNPNETINVAFPLVSTRYSSNINSFSSGLEGVSIYILKNENMNVNNFTNKMNDSTRFEITFQNKLNSSGENIIKDSYNISAIPNTCSGHINKSATNYGDPNSIDIGNQCTKNDYSYQLTAPYYDGPKNGPMFTSAYNEDSYVCGFPERFSSKVIQKCKEYGYKINQTDPGNVIQGDRVNLDDIIGCGINTAYLCALDQRNDQIQSDGTESIGINYDLQVKSGSQILKTLFAPDSGGYENQKKWNIYEKIKQNVWNAYGYPYQEELNADVLDSVKPLSIIDGTETIYELKDIVLNNKINGDKIESTLPDKSMENKGNIRVYELNYHDLGSCIKDENI